MVSTRSRGGRPLPPPRAARAIAKYHPNDTTHRHRLPDKRKKAVAVVTHKRRLPGKAA
jgi:hypothetical protein